MSAPAIAGSLPITFADQAMTLLGDRAIWWPGAKSLVLADLHLGKAAAFRTHGIPVPAGGTARDLLRISALLLATGAARLVILGDFLHARAGRQPEVLDAIGRWRQSHEKIEILLIRGNHDRSAGRVLPEWRITEVEEPFLDHGLALLHHPEHATDRPAMAGHVHPVTTIHDYDGSMINVPSFVQDVDRLILPSFGGFTGGHKMGKQPGRQVFLVMSGRVIATKTG